MKCTENAGFLIPRPCGQEAINQCSLCQKPVCTVHTVVLPDGATACADCAADQGVGPLAERERMWGYYGYDTGPAIIYTESDYGAFADQPAGEVMEEQLAES